MESKGESLRDAKTNVVVGTDYLPDDASPTESVASPEMVEHALDDLLSDLRALEKTVASYRFLKSPLLTEVAQRLKQTRLMVKPQDDDLVYQLPEGLTKLARHEKDKRERLLLAFRNAGRLAFDPWAEMVESEDILRLGAIMPDDETFEEAVQAKWDVLRHDKALEKYFSGLFGDATLFDADANRPSPALCAWLVGWLQGLVFERDEICGRN